MGISTAPWWGASVIALGSSVFTLVVTSLFAVRNTRTEQRRLSRGDKIALYPQLARAGRTLSETPIWPIDTEGANQRLDSVLELAEQVSFLGSTRVNVAVENLLTTAKKHHAVIADIQQDSKPGHRGSVDLRFQPQHTTSVADLRRAIENFVRAGRHELEIRGAYHPIEETSQGQDSTS